MIVRNGALALSWLGAMLISGAAPEADYYPWVMAESEFGRADVSVDSAGDLVRSHISIADFAYVESRVVHESRGRSDLDIFYSRHLVEPTIPLIVVARRDSPEVVACALPDTFVSANMFVRGGRLDARTCLADVQADGVFDEIRWSASRADHHSVHSFRVISFEPPVVTNTRYRRLATLAGPPADLPTYLDITITYDPGDGGFIRATATAPDGVIVVRDRMRLPRSNSRSREFEFFGFALDVMRSTPDSFVWHAVRTLPEGQRFRLSYDYRR